MKLYLALALLLVLAQSTPVNFDRNCTGGDTDHQTWYFGTTPAERCVSDTCASYLDELVALLDTTNAGITVAQDANNENEVKVTIAHSVATCGAGNDEECLTADCFTVKLSTLALTTANGTTTGDRLEQTVTGDIVSTEFVITNTYYKNDQLCTDNSNGTFTCDFKVEYEFAGIDSELFASRSFSVELTQLASRDIVTAEIVNADIQAAEITLANDVTENIRDLPNDLTGTLTRDGTGAIRIGSTVTLTLEIPSHNTRQFDLTTLKLELTHASGSITVATAAAQNTGTAGNANTLSFTYEASFVGTYNLKATATLVAARRRLVQTIDTVNGELEVTVLPQESNNSLLYILAAISVIFALSAAFLGLQLKKYKQSRSQQYKQQNDTQNDIEISTA